MPRTRTATQILTAARERADMDQPGTGPAFVDDTEGIERVNTSLGALWDLLVEAGGEHLLISTQQQADVTAPTWPSDLLQLLAIEVSEDSGVTWHPLDRIDARDLHRAKAGTGRPTHYSFTDTLESTPTVTVWPSSSTSFYYRIIYVPEPAEVDEGSDNITLPNRWHQWVELDVAIDMLTKEESDTSALERKRERVEAAILKLASRRDAYRSAKVRDTRGVMTGRGRRSRYHELYDRGWGW